MGEVHYSESREDRGRGAGSQGLRQLGTLAVKDGPRQLRTRQERRKERNGKRGCRGTKWYVGHECWLLRSLPVPKTNNLLNSPHPWPKYGSVVITFGHITLPWSFQVVFRKNSAKNSYLKHSKCYCGYLMKVQEILVGKHIFLGYQTPLRLYLP